MSEHETSTETVPAIERRLELAASPEKVWAALTDPAELAAWFPDRGARLDLRAGGEGFFEWREHGRFAARVERIEPGRYLAWRWARKAGVALEDSPSTLVEWTLTPAENGGGTVLELRESGFARPEDRADNVGGWRHELAELVAHLDAR